jgi:aspartate 1-decarboxylase
MLIEVLKSKIAYATVTQTELRYVGSITIAEDLMEKTNLRANEKVSVVNLNNGERFETYVIVGTAGSNIIAVNGPAARLAQTGDLVFILSYASINPDTETVEPVIMNLQS